MIFLEPRETFDPFILWTDTQGVIHYSADRIIEHLTEEIKESLSEQGLEDSELDSQAQTEAIDHFEYNFVRLYYLGKGAPVFHYEDDEQVDHPEHYQSDKMEVIDIIEAYQLNFCLGNVVKYVLRAGRKTSDGTQDLEKALWYLKRELGEGQ